MKPTLLFLLLIIAGIALSICGLLSVPLAYIIIGSAIVLMIYIYSTFVNPFKQEWYKIHKGWHYSIIGFFSMLFPFTRMYNSDKHNIIFTFMLPKNCHYDTNNLDMNFWNKLCGVVLKGGVHNSSIRIAWRPITKLDEYIVCFYWYENGVRFTSEPIGLKYGKHYFARLTKTDFTIYEETPEKPLARFYFPEESLLKYDNKMRYLLLPYFGGKERAMKKFNIYLKTDKFNKND